MDIKLSKIYYSPQGYWKGIASIKKLAIAAKVSESDSKNGWYAEPFGKSIFLRQNTFLAPKIPRPPQKPFTRQTFLSFGRILLGVAGPENIQIRFDCRRFGQPFQRSWTLDLERLCWSGEVFSENLQTRAFETATAFASGPRERVHGSCHQRDGKTNEMT